MEEPFPGLESIWTIDLLNGPIKIPDHTKNDVARKVIRVSVNTLY